MKKELLAPNGKPSKLTPEQYKLVRTPAFKKWFGDWENDPKNSSKVVDENGEPLILFHGTDVNFSVFDLSKIGEGSDLLGKGIYLTENKNVANFYANHVSKKRYIVRYEEGVFGSEVPIYEKDADKKAEKHKVIYDFFVKAKKIIDINEVEVDENIKQIIIKSIIELFDDNSEKYVEDAIKFAHNNKEKIRNYRGVILYLIYRFPDTKEGIIKYIKNKYDCIIFEPTTEFESNLRDFNYKNYVVFNANQIKLADGSNTTFDANNDDIRFNNGGEIDEYAQQLIDIISSNPQLEKYQKYKVILKDKFGINFDDFYKDDYYIENANISEIKVNDDFINYDKYIEYAKKIFRLRGLISDYHAQNIEGIVSIDKAIEIGKKLNFIVEHKEYDGGSGNYASHTIDTITMPNKVDINSFIHEIGHHYDHFESKEYKGLANTSTYASSLYEIGKSDEVFAENFKNYFIAPNWLKEKLPMVYNELDKNINDVYKEEIYKLINSSKEIYRLGGEVNTGLFSQIWGWFGIKF